MTIIRLLNNKKSVIVLMKYFQSNLRTVSDNETYNVLVEDILKKRCIIVLFLICALLFTGCKSINLTAEQSDLVAEYVAGVMVKHSYSYEYKYRDYQKESLPEESESSDVPEETESSSEDETEPESDIFNISEYIGISPVIVRFDEYKVTDEYPDDEDALFSFTPEPGYRFMVVEFNLENPSSDAVVLNTINRNIVFRADIDGHKYNNYATLLLNDITRLDNVELNAGNTMKAVIVFMLEESVANNINNVFVSLVEAGDGASIDVR